MEAKLLSNKALETMQPGSARVRDKQLPIVAVPAKFKSRVSLYLVKRRPGVKSAPWVKLGVYPEITWTTARAKALNLLAAQALGNSNKLSLAKAMFNQLQTVGDLLKWYLEEVSQEVHLSESRRRNVTSIITNHLLPRLADVPLMAITVPLIKERLIRPLYDKYKLSYLELIQRTLKQVYAAAVAGKLITISPIADVTLKSFTTARVKPKTAAFNPGELQRVIGLIAAERRPWLRMMAGWQLMYAMRINEVAQIAWRPQIDIDNRLYRQPADVAKNDQGHVMPLTDVALTLLRYHKRSQRRYGHRGNWLFPAARNPWRHVNSNYACDLVSGILADGSGHDLRKLARRWWAENKVDTYVAELMLNHKRGVLMDTYIQDLLLGNCRDALSMWHNQLMKLGLGVAICGK